MRPTWAEISISKFIRNIKRIKSIIAKKTKFLLVVKADAYGHGAVALAHFAEKESLCDFLGVSSIEEGIELREKGIRLPIIILGSIYPTKNFPYLTKYNLTPTISSLMLLKELVRYLRKTSSRMNIHIKLETGMNRIGASESVAMKMIEYISSSPNIKIEGIYSHFSSADSDKSFTESQLERFLRFTSSIKNINFIRHIANSYATVSFPKSHLDMVRCGIAAYGSIDGFEEIMTLKTRVVFLKYIKKSSPVSYSKAFVAPKRIRVATIPVGYGDGYLRSLSNKALVMIRGRYAPVIGNITMDMTMIDVSDIKDIKIGDEVVILGGGFDKISIKQTAVKAQTIPYEITTLITKRVRRIYK
ncbi:MAG: alanine racemase [Elusimicrobiales bacterium]